MDWVVVLATRCANGKEAKNASSNSLLRRRPVSERPNRRFSRNVGNVVLERHFLAQPLSPLD
jgi:hypothetical protein